MNHKVKKLLHIIVVECNISIKKLIEYWDNVDNVRVKFQYSIFVKEKYKDIKQQNQKMTKKEINKLVRQQWKDLNEEERMKYLVIEEKKERKKSNYNLFFKSQYQIIKKENPNLSMGDISKKISELWKENKKKCETNENNDINTNKTTTELKQDIKNETEFEQTTILDQTTEPKNVKTSPLKSTSNLNEKISDQEEDIDEKFNKVFTKHCNLDKDTKNLFVKLSNDRFLSDNEKNEINGIWTCLSQKSLEQAIKMYQNYYDEKLPDNVILNDILEKVYNKERKNFISQKRNEKINMIPKELLELDAIEINFLNKKQLSFEKMEQWSLYCKFRALHPNFEEEDDAEEMSKPEIIDHLIRYEKDRILNIKIDKILETN